MARRWLHAGIIAVAFVLVSCGANDRLAELERENDELRDRLEAVTSTTELLAPVATSPPHAAIDAGTSSTTTTIDGPPNSPTTGAPVTDDAVTVSVLSVVDGDTIRVLYEGEAESLRLIGINAPEQEECLYTEAASRLAELVGDEVHLESDRTDRDQFGRLLRYVFAGDVFVNEAMVREGLAISRHYEPDTARQGALDAAQEQAQEEEIGMWDANACGSAVGFLSPGTATIAIKQIRYNADGDDNHNLNDEWVEFTNAGRENIDLTGWGIKDESAGHRYLFPSGFTLAAAATVRLHTGCGDDTATTLHWCNQGSAVWNNSGDTVFVLDPSGNVVVSESYSG